MKMNARNTITGPILAGLAVLFLAAGFLDQANATTVSIGALKDATIYSDSGGNARANGAGQFLFAGNNFGGDTRRALLEFDIAGAGIPSGSTINSVTLELVLVTSPLGGVNASPLSLSLHEALGDWTEGTSVPTGAGGGEGNGASVFTDGVTYMRSTFDTVSWTTLGGDFVGAASASTIVSGAGTWSWTGAGMVADAQGWLDTPSTNFGWFLNMDVETDTATAKRFGSRQNSTTGQRPALTLDFTEPATVPEPSTVLLLGSGLAGLALWRKRKAA